MTCSLEERGGASPSAVAERGVHRHVGVNVHRCRLLELVIEGHDSLLWVGPRMLMMVRGWRNVVERLPA